MAILPFQPRTPEDDEDELLSLQGMSPMVPPVQSIEAPPMNLDAPVNLGIVPSPVDAPMIPQTRTSDAAPSVDQLPASAHFDAQPMSPEEVGGSESFVGTEAPKPAQQDPNLFALNFLSGLSGQKTPGLSWKNSEAALKDMKDTAGRQASAIDELAQAQVGASDALAARREEQAQLDRDEAQRKKLVAEQRQQLGVDAEKQAQADENELRNMDTKGWWASKDTGEQIGLGILMVLGGAAARFTGGNIPLAMIDKSIQDDFNQKRMQAAKITTIQQMHQNSYARKLATFGDVELAKQAEFISNYRAVDRMIEAETAKWNKPAVLAKAKIAREEVGQKINEATFAFGQRKDQLANERAMQIAAQQAATARASLPYLQQLQAQQRVGEMMKGDEEGAVFQQAIRDMDMAGNLPKGTASKMMTERGKAVALKEEVEQMHRYMEEAKQIGPVAWAADPANRAKLDAIKGRSLFLAKKFLGDALSEGERKQALSMFDIDTFRTKERIEEQQRNLERLGNEGITRMAPTIRGMLPERFLPRIGGVQRGGTEIGRPRER